MKFKVGDLAIIDSKEIWSDQNGQRIRITSIDKTIATFIFNDRKLEFDYHIRINEIRHLTKLEQALL